MTNSTAEDELAKAIWRELKAEFPIYDMIPDPMACAMIRVGITNGINRGKIELTYTSEEVIPMLSDIAIQASNTQLTQKEADILARQYLLDRYEKALKILRGEENDS